MFKVKFLQEFRRWRLTFFWWAKLPRPAHAPYLHPCRQNESKQSKLFAIHGTATYRSSWTQKAHS